MESIEVKSPTPGLPIYPNGRHFLHIIDGIPYALYRRTYLQIVEQGGNPQAQADWADPDVWIAERLRGDEQKLALRVWHESSRELNPRYMRGPYYLALRHNLLAKDPRDVLRLTERGQQFLAEPDGHVVAEVDAYEGVLTILRLVAERGPGRRSDFLPDYETYCRTETSYRSETVIKHSLYGK